MLTFKQWRLEKTILSAFRMGRWQKTIKGEVLKCDPRSTIHMIHTIQTQTKFRPVQQYYCHLNKECNLNQSKDDSFVG